MGKEELEYMERVLRENFKEHLKKLNVDGANDMCAVKTIKTYGALWHYVRQLMLAEDGMSSDNEGLLEIKARAAGLKEAK